MGSSRPDLVAVCTVQGELAAHVIKSHLEKVNSWDNIPDIRYDRMFGALGCHTEYVTEPGEIRPALYRAFNSGLPSR